MPIFSGVSKSTWPAAGVVVPNDSTILPPTVGGLWIGGAGNVAVEMLSGAVVTFNAVAAGTRLPVCVTKVRLTNTTATLIVAIS
jgi:hypothetical protein